MFIKFCGFTRFEDIDVVARLPVSAVGFIFYKKSKRYVTPAKANELQDRLKKINKEILIVGIFVESSVQEIFEIKKEAGLDYLQIYDHSIIAYRLNSINEFDFEVKLNSNDFILLDAKISGSMGGAGKSFDWTGLENFRYLDRTIVAGGLNESNVRGLLKKCRPFGLDISSGIEEAPGIKSEKKMLDFIKEICNNESGELK